MKDGYQVVGEADEADTVIVNTCGFIEDSKKESIQRILEMGELKQEGKIKKSRRRRMPYSALQRRSCRRLARGRSFCRLWRVSKYF